MTFLVRPIPADGEGPNAFVLRVAAANRLTVPHVLDLGIGARWPAVQAALDLLRPLSRRSAAFCPRCLGENGIGLASWEIVFSDACPRCGHWLVDVCSDCGATVGWLRDDLARCLCGKRLTNEAEASAPSALVALSRRFEASLHAQDAEGDWLSRLRTDQLARLVRLLGTYGSGDGRRRPQKGTFAACIGASWQVSSLAAEVLAGWPRSFHSYLDSIAARDATSLRTGSLPRVFGGFYVALYRAFGATEFDPVRDEFERYVLEHWTGALGQRNRRFSEGFLRHACWLPASYVCRQTNVSRRRLESMVSCGEVRGGQRTTQAGRSFLVVHRDDVGRLASRVGEEQTLADAAAALGLKRSRLASLLPVICPQAGRQVDDRSPWSIPRAWVVGWLDRLSRLEYVRPGPGLVTLEHVLRFGAWPDVRIARLLLDIAAGDLPVVGRVDGTGGLSGLLFDGAVLAARTAAERLPTSALTVPEVAARLGIKQEVAYLLVRSGLLASTTSRTSSRGASFVSEEQLTRFTVAFVWGRDVAAALGRSPKATAAGLRDAGVLAVSGPGIDSGRQFLFRRDEVSRAIQVDLPALSPPRGRSEGVCVAPRSARDSG